DGSSTRLGWLHRDASNDWAAGGASSAGVDTVAGKSFQLPALRPVGTEAVTIPLDVAQVQSWIDAPATNQGIMLVNNNPGDIVNITSTVGTQANRPILTVVVGSGPGVQVTISPTSASVATGATKQFTATVANATDTGVTWTATGGTISSSGLYTAGTTPGTFSVTATSMLDPTKSASSTVTVGSPQPISV